MATKLGIELPKTNLTFNGTSMTESGQKQINLAFGSKRGFSIQLNGTLPLTSGILRGMRVETQKKLSETDLQVIAKELARYIRTNGSKMQRETLKTYF